MPGKHFNAAAFDAKVNEGNAMFQQAIANEKFTVRRPVLIDLKPKFDDDAAHLRSKASQGKITPALAAEMKIVNKIYDHALGQKPKRRKSSQKSELDSALDQVSDKSVAAAMKEFQDFYAHEG